MVEMNDLFVNLLFDVVFHSNQSFRLHLFPKFLLWVEISAAGGEQCKASKPSQCRKSSWTWAN